MKPFLSTRMCVVAAAILVAEGALATVLAYARNSVVLAILSTACFIMGAVFFHEVRARRAR